MKHVVTEQYLDEAQVHPPEVSRHFGQAIAESLKELLNSKDSFSEVNSPYSDSPGSSAFSKAGFDYVHCHASESLFLSPRPSAEKVRWYFKKSPRAKYRQSKSYLDATQALRAHQTQIHASWVKRLLKSKTKIPQSVLEVESETPDLLIALRALGFEIAYSLNPRCSDALLKKHQIRSIHSNRLAQSMIGKFGVVAAFRTFEQQFDQKAFIEEAFHLLAPGGHLILTSRVASGFDIQVLWENAKISPIEHLNLPSVEGVKQLIKSIGFSIQELSTPGQLDVQLLEKAIRENSKLELPRWIDYFINNRDQYAKVKLQTFLQENLLSSNLRLVAKKI